MSYCCGKFENEAISGRIQKINDRNPDWYARMISPGESDANAFDLIRIKFCPWCGKQVSP